MYLYLYFWNNWIEISLYYYFNIVAQQLNTCICNLEAELQSTTPSSIAASWTSWAVMSIADKLYKPKSQNSQEGSSKSPSPEVEGIIIVFVIF